MANDARISLTDNLQFKWFANAMNAMNRNKRKLTAYDRELYQKLRDGWDLVGRELTLTVKQMNHIKQVAAELEQNKYG